MISNNSRYVEQDIEPLEMKTIMVHMKADVWRTQYNKRYLYDE
jgi:hypothetical protein